MQPMVNYGGSEPTNPRTPADQLKKSAIEYRARCKRHMREAVQRAEKQSKNK